jgi:hypothetical protein
MCNANSNDAAQVKVFRISGQNSSAIWPDATGWLKKRCGRIRAFINMVTNGGW